MAVNVPLQCSCGKVRGVAKDVGPERGVRVTCLCDDCQAYAHWLGDADKMLDANGGTDIYQLHPNRVEFHQGQDLIRCVRLSEKGMFRWYADCCRTPVGNTLASAKAPFVGIPHSFMDHEGHGQSREQSLGRTRAKVNAKFAVGTPEDAHTKAPVGIMFKVLGLLLGGVLRRAHKGSPYFDQQSGNPIAEPSVLGAAERDALREHCGPKA